MRARLELLASAAPALVAAMLLLLAVAYVPAGEEALVPAGLMQPKALVVLIFLPALVAACVAAMIISGNRLARVWVVLLGALTVLYTLSYLRWLGTADHEVPMNVILFAVTFLALSATPGATAGVLGGLLAAGLACATLITLQSFGIQPPGWRPSPAIAGPAGTFLHRNMSAYTIAAAVPFAAHLALRAPTPARLALLVPALATLGSGLILSRSRGVWLACLIACACMAVVGWRRGSHRRLAVGALLTTTVIGGALIAARTAPPLRYGGQIVVDQAELAALPDVERANVEHERVATRLNVTESNDSFNKRETIWWQALRGAADRPMLGHGPGRFPTFAQDRGLFAHENTPYQHAHNDFLHGVVEAGWAAGLVLLTFTSLVLLGGLRATRRDPERWPPVLLAVAVVFAIRAMIEIQVTSPAINLFAAASFAALVAGLPAAGAGRSAGAARLVLAGAVTVLVLAAIALGPYRGLAG